MDTGASKHYVPKPLTTKIYDSAPIQISQPDGSILLSNQTTSLPLSPETLPHAAIEANIVPTIGQPIISIGQLCDHDCVANFTKHTAKVTHHDHLIMEGTRNTDNGLWYFNLVDDTPMHNHSCNALRPSFTIAQQVAYYHACLGSPPLSTLCHAIDAGHLVTFPTLTSSQVRKYPPLSMATHQGHLDQTRANEHSTKGRQHTSRDLFIGLVEDMESPTTLHRPGTTFSDITGKFIVPSSQGNNYILVIFDGDSNYIFAEPIPSRTSEQIVRAYNRVHTLLTNRGLTPQLHITDNETSAQLKTFLTSRGVQYQLVPPHQHRANAAERAIRTFKNHFISTLCSCDPNFPLHLWDRLLEQSVTTLNLLRTSSLNNRLSAYAQVHGAFDFNTTPLGPPGTKVLVHDKPTTRGTWAPHGTEGWYTGPAMDHYRSFTTYIPSTRSTRVADTLAWFPSQVTMPRASSADMAMAAAYDLTQALLHPSPSSALSPISDSQRHALVQLAEIFRTATGLTITEPRLTTEGDLPVNQMTDPLDTETGNTTAEPRVTPAIEISPDHTPEHDCLECLDPMPPPAAQHSNTPETSYSSYIHNGPQRRRKAKHNRRYRNPIAPPSASPVLPSPDHGSTTSTDETVRCSNVSTQPEQQSTPSPVDIHLRRSRRGSKIVRFDPKTHRILPQPHGLQHTVTALPTSVTDTTSNQHEALRLPRLRKGPDAAKWEHALVKEWGRLAQGMPDMVAGTDTIHFIPHSAKPPDRISSYCRAVCAYNENKEEKERVRLTYGGDRSDYPFAVSTTTVDVTTVKLHFNSIISTPNARHMTLDLKNFYLNTPLTRFEYMKVPLTMIPQSVIDHYNLLDIATDGFVMVEIVKGIYGLPQSGILAKALLDERLAAGGYHPAPHTPGLYLHETRKISFTLWVDDFSVKYISKADVQHLIDLLQQHYEMTVDWTGTKYLGLSLHWDYVHRTVDLSMPGYIERALQRFNHQPPTRPQHSPHSWTAPQYGAKIQMTEDEQESPRLSPSNIKRLQEIIGVLLFYARMVDNTMLVAIATLASAQATATEATMEAAVQLLNYAATHPDAKIRYTASDMVLHIVSDASYLSASEARSRLGGYFFMSQPLAKSPDHPEDTPPPFNGPILVNSQIIQPVVASAAEAEFAAVFYNAKDGCMLRNTLLDMGHPQPATPIQTDNACAVGLANNTIKQKRSKAINMRFYWIRDRVKDGQFVIYWQKGSDNDADYFTKHHPPAVHRRKRSRYLHDDTKTHELHS